jgi:RHS repeat-associated protein
MRSSNVNGTSVNYTYDQANQLATVTDNAAPTGDRPGTGTTTYRYDAAGNPTGYVFPNGVQTADSYDSLNRLTAVTISNATTMLASYAYTLGPAGNRLSVTELSGRHVDYGYDKLYRLTSEAISSDPTVSDNGTIQYTYDAVGNRLTRNSTTTAVPSASYTYDANDRLTTVSGGSGPTSMAYDANGNTTTAGGTTYSYDFENQMTQVMSGSTTIAYTYDGDGNRVAKTENGVTTQYLVEEIVNGAVQRTYTYGFTLINQDQLLGGTWTPSFYGYDGHGNVRLLTDANGISTDTYDYDAFGLVMHTTGSTLNQHLYAGEYFDRDDALYYLRARYYSDTSGRFITPDSFAGDASDPSTLNLYAYTRNNPVSSADPSGHEDTIAEVSLDEPAIAGFSLTALPTFSTNNAIATTGVTNPAPQAASFSDLWKNYPRPQTYPTDASGDQTSIWDLIGGKVLWNHQNNPDQFSNSCAVRLSYSLNYGGITIPFASGQTISGNDKNWYYYRITSMQKYLNSVVGTPTAYRPSTWQQQLAGQTGIVLFNVPWGDASGHLDLFDGNTTVDGKDYSSEATQVLFWPVK